VCQLKVLYTNANSFLNKRDELHAFVKDEKPDFIGITES
jgi:hypothetical protein